MQELNLIPYHLKQKKLKKIKYRNHILLGIIGVFIILLLIYIPISELIKTRAVEAFYKEQSEKLDGTMIDIKNENIKKEIEHYRLYIDKLKYLVQNKTIISDRIHELEKYTPEDVVLEGLKFGDNGLDINATAVNFNSISEFAANMQLAGTYKLVRVNNIGVESQSEEGSIQKNEVYMFIINAVE